MSSLPTMPSYFARTIPSPSTTKTHGIAGRRPRGVAEAERGRLVVERRVGEVAREDRRLGHDLVLERLEVDERDLVRPAVDEVADHRDRAAARGRDLEPRRVDDEDVRPAGGAGVGRGLAVQPQVGWPPGS